MRLRYCAVANLHRVRPAVLVATMRLTPAIRRGKRKLAATGRAISRAWLKPRSRNRARMHRNGNEGVDVDIETRLEISRQDQAERSAEITSRSELQGVNLGDRGLCIG